MVGCDKNNCYAACVIFCVENKAASILQSEMFIALTSHNNFLERGKIGIKKIYIYL